MRQLFCQLCNAHLHTRTHALNAQKLSKAVKLSRTGPSSSSSFIHQRSTLWPAHPIEQTFILSILQFPQQSSFRAWLGLFTVLSMCHEVSRSQRSGGAERDTSATASCHRYKWTGCLVQPCSFGKKLYCIFYKNK